MGGGVEIGSCVPRWKAEGGGEEQDQKEVVVEKEEENEDKEDKGEVEEKGRRE